MADIRQSPIELPEEPLSDEKMDQTIEEAAARERVSPFDPDFLLILMFAMIVDALDIVLEITGVVVIPKLVGIGLDGFTFAIIVGWLYWRVDRITKSKKGQREALQSTITNQIEKLKRLQKLGRVSPEVFERYMQRYSRQMGRGGQLVARAIRRPLARTLIRGGITILGEVAWIAGLIPFWVIAVLLALREK